MTQALSSTDYVIYMDGKPFVERKGLRFQKEEKQITAILEKIKTDENMIDFSSLNGDEKSIISSLLCLSLKGKDPTLEEVNGMDVQEVIPYICKEFESISDKKSVSTYDDLQQFMGSFDEIREKFCKENEMSIVRLVEGRRTDVMIPNVHTKISNEHLQTIFHTLNEEYPFNILGADDIDVVNYMQTLINEHGGLDILMSKILKIVSSEFCDDITVLTREGTKDKLSLGDKITGHAFISGVPAKISSVVSNVDKDGKIELKVEDVKIILDEMNINYEGKNDVKKRVKNDLTSTDSLVHKKRNALYDVQKKLQNKEDLTESEKNTALKAVTSFAQRLWFYNIAAGYNGKQVGVKKDEILSHSAHDANGFLNNKPHAYAGVQNGLRMPFGNKGNIRFWNEANRESSQMGIEDLSFAKTVSFLINALYDADNIYEAK